MLFKVGGSETRNEIFWSGTANTRIRGIKSRKKAEKEFGLDAVIVIESRAILIAD
jgi:hypothetical protein